MNGIVHEYFVGLVFSLVCTFLFSPGVFRALEPFQGFEKKEPMTGDEMASRVRFSRCGIYTLSAFFPAIPRLIYPLNWLCPILLAPIVFYLFWRIHLSFESHGTLGADGEAHARTKHGE